MNNLKLLRTKNMMTQKDVSEYLGVSRPTYTTYEIESRDIPTDVLIKLSKLYKVSVDYLLGNCSIEESNKGMIEDNLHKIFSHFKYIESEFEKLDKLDENEKNEIRDDLKEMTNDLKIAHTYIKSMIALLENGDNYACGEHIKTVTEAIKSVDTPTRKRMVDTLKAAFPQAFYDYEWALGIIKEKNLAVYTQLKEGKSELSENDIINMAKALNGKE